MGRRRSKKSSTMVTALAMVAVAVFAVSSLARNGKWFLLAELLLIAVAVGGTWVLFFRSTRCGYTTRAEKPCRHSAPGELRGCKKFHKGLKAEALLNYLKIPHPRQLMQRKWLPTGDGAPSPAVDEPQGRLERPVFDTVGLVATVFSAVTSVAMPLIQLALA